MKYILQILLFTASFSVEGFAQKHLQGRWEGSLIQDGKEYILKMDITRKGQKLHDLFKPLHAYWRAAY